MNLQNWTVDQNWTDPQRSLPEFLNNDGYMGKLSHQEIQFTMFWHKRESLYLVSLPVPGAPVLPFDYHTIQVIDCSKNTYLMDYKKKIVDILNPYEDFDSCFIENDRKIICFGPKGFTFYDIVLSQTKVCISQ